MSIRVCYRVVFLFSIKQFQVTTKAVYDGRIDFKGEVHIYRGAERKFTGPDL